MLYPESKVGWYCSERSESHWRKIWVTYHGETRYIYDGYTQLSAKNRDLRDSNQFDEVSLGG